MRSTGANINCSGKLLKKSSVQSGPGGAQQDKRHKASQQAPLSRPSSRSGRSSSSRARTQLNRLSGPKTRTAEEEFVRFGCVRQEAHETYRGGRGDACVGDF